MVTWDRVCDLVSVLPEVEQGASYGTPTCKIRGKLFVRLLEGGERIAIFTNEREALVTAAPQTFTVPAHYVNYPMVVVALDTVDPVELSELLAESWRIRAPKRLAASLPR